MANNDLDFDYDLSFLTDQTQEGLIPETFVDLNSIVSHLNYEIVLS